MFPSEQLYSGRRVLAPLWADLAILPGGWGHGIWVSYVDGVIYIEWIASPPNNPSDYYHFQFAQGFEGDKSRSYYQYFEMGTGLTTTVVGMQSTSPSKCSTPTPFPPLVHTTGDGTCEE